MHMATHVLITGEDLADLLHHFGPEHAFYQRARDALAELINPEFAKYREAASRQARDGELEIDAGAVVSKGDDPGAYVMAWLWIDDDELAARAAVNAAGAVR